jgi:cold shock CspA family protein
VERRTGNVASFDDPAGYGVVADGEGGEWFFHCTAIADGTRTIEVGATVAFEVVAGRNGQWEAADLRVVGESPTAGAA